VFDVLGGHLTPSDLLCQDAVCCPPEGRSLDEVSDSELAAHMVLTAGPSWVARPTWSQTSSRCPKILSRRRLAGQGADPETVLRTAGAAR
jgi:hypothetical protein